MPELGTGTVAELKKQLSPESSLAAFVVSEFEKYKNQRAEFDAENREVQEFIFGTATDQTTNKVLPWQNSTRLPKLTQIRDNLHANYMAALFPNDDWMRWTGDTSEDEEKAQAIEEFLKNKIKNSDFRETVSRLVYDYIDNGNAFGDVEWVSEKKTNADGEEVPGFVGPKLVRYSLSEMYVNPTAPDFDTALKITRTLTTLGALASAVDDHPEQKWIKDTFEKAMENRSYLRGHFDVADFAAANAYSVEGFGNLHEYYGSHLVELLNFEGDFYDVDTKELLKDHVVTVMDRKWVIRKSPIDSWLPNGTKAHVGWRLRPENLYAQGPLAGLAGMQYRIDHLENLKADVFDLIAFPVLKVRGEVEDFEWAPMQKILLDEEGSDVEMLVPDTTALQADLQIQLLEDKMELYAGAPREAMGVRTPGEKTAFEVEQLQSAAVRIFNEKVQNFELNFLEPLLNAMLEISVRNLTEVQVIKVLDAEIAAPMFRKITKDDLKANGRIRPQGARHFAMQQKIVQSVTGIFNSPVGEIISPHLSGEALASMIESALGLEKYELFAPNKAVAEQAQTARSQGAAESQVLEEQLIDTDPEVPDAS